jgi:hypothetical protein
MAHALALHQLGRSREAVKELDLLKASEDPDVEYLRRRMVDDASSRLVTDGFGAWSGKRPDGAKKPVPTSPGPPVSDYVIEDRA